MLLNVQESVLFDVYVLRKLSWLSCYGATWLASQLVLQHAFTGRSEK